MTLKDIMMEDMNQMLKASFSINGKGVEMVDAETGEVTVQQMTDKQIQTALVYAVWHLLEWAVRRSK